MEVLLAAPRKVYKVVCTVDIETGLGSRGIQGKKNNISLYSERHQYINHFVSSQKVVVPYLIGALHEVRESA